MDPVAQPKQPIGIEEGRPQARFLRDLLRNLTTFWSKELHRLNHVLPMDGTEPMTGPLELATYTVATLPTASDYPGSVIYVSDGGPAYSRALALKQAVHQSIPDVTPTNVIWQGTLYDTGGWFGSSGDTFLTVPTGVTKVRLNGNGLWNVAAGAYRSIRFTKNGAAFGGESSNFEVPTGAALFDSEAAVSPTVSASSGDLFRLAVSQSSGAALQLLAGNNTHFGIEAVEFAEGYGGTFQGSNGTRWMPLG